MIWCPQRSTAWSWRLIITYIRLVLNTLLDDSVDVCLKLKSIHFTNWLKSSSAGKFSITILKSGLCSHSLLNFYFYILEMHQYGHFWPILIFRWQIQPITDTNKQPNRAHDTPDVVTERGWGPFFSSCVACIISTVSTWPSTGEKWKQQAGAC